MSEGSAVFHHGLLLLLFYNIYNHYILFCYLCFSLDIPDFCGSIISTIGEKIGDLLEKRLEVYKVFNRRSDIFPAMVSLITVILFPVENDLVVFSLQPENS